MSLEHVEAFYERLASDDSFRDRLKNVKSKSECTQIMREAGYYFTQREYEEYTELLLEFKGNNELRNLEQQELEAIMGGTKPFIKYTDVQPPYGVIDLLDL